MNYTHWHVNGIDTILSTEESIAKVFYPERDAAVIAAAPDMLALLKLILRRLDLEPVEAIFPCSAMRHDIRRVIAEATS